jgi:hypothetical protein
MSSSFYQWINPTSYSSRGSIIVASNVIADDPNEGSNDDNESLEVYDIHCTPDQDE